MVCFFSLCQRNIEVGVFGALLTDDPPPRGSPDLVIAHYLSLAGWTDYDALAHARNRQEEDAREGVIRRL